MIIRYTKEELEVAEEMIILTFDKKGFRETKAKINKVTDKKIFFERNVGVGTPQKFHTDLGGNFDYFEFIHNERNCMVRKAVILLQQDVENVKKLIIENAKAKIQNSIDSLQEQLSKI